MGLNLSIIMGRITADPELRTTQSGVSVVRFQVAVDRDYKSGDERQADFIDCVAWRGTADFISRYFKKGQMIALYGSTQTRSVENKSGFKYKVSEINVDKVTFCGDKSIGGGRSLLEQAIEMVNIDRAERASADAEEYMPEDEDEGLPF